VRRALAVAVLGLLAVLLAAPAAAGTTWWNEDLGFRTEVEVRPEATTPVTGRAATVGGEDPLVLVPLDVTDALARTQQAPGPSWPLDGSGRPERFTFQPASVRVLDAGPDGQLPEDPDQALRPATFLPYPVDRSDPGDPFDPQTNAAGTLAVLLEGEFDEPRTLQVYLDRAEDGPTPDQRLDERAEGRLGHLASPGPLVHARFQVPGVPGEAEVNLVAMAVEDGRQPAVTVERLPPGRQAETLVARDEGTVTDRIERFELPASTSGYPVRVDASRPVVLAVETVLPNPSGSATPVYPSLDGGPRGTHHLVPGLDGTRASPTAHVVAAGDPAAVTVTDATTGGRVTELRTGAQDPAALDVPEGDVYELESDEPVLVIGKGEAADGTDRFLHQTVARGPVPQDARRVGQRATGHAAVAQAPTSVTAFPLSAPQDAVTGRAGDDPRFTWESSTAAQPETEPWSFFFEETEGQVLVGEDGHAVLRGERGERFRAPVPADLGSTGVDARLTAPLPDTEATVEHRTANGTEAAAGSTTLSRPGSVATVPGEQVPLTVPGQVLDVETDRPTVLQLGRTGAPATFFVPGLPPVAQAQAAPTSFFGSLVSWSPSLTNVQASPGQRLDVELTVENRGVDLDGSPRSETLNLTADPVDQGASCEQAWPARLTRGQLADVPSPGEATVTLLVDVPEDAEPGACAEVEVSATPQDGTPVTARVVASVRSGFEPRLDVRRADGTLGETGALALDGTEPGRRTLVLANAGAQAGDAQLRYTPGPGYQSRVLGPNGTVLAAGDGAPQSPIEVPANGSVELDLVVEAEDEGVAPWEFFVEAVARQDPTLRDDATVGAAPEADTSLVVAAGAPRVRAPPGGTGNVTVEVTNLGDAVEVDLEPTTDLPPGWSIEVEPDRTLLREEGTTDGEGTPLDRGNVTVSVRPPANASLGESVPFDVTVAPSVDPSAAERTTLTARVVNGLDLEVEVPAALATPPGRPVEAAVDLTADADGPMNVTLDEVLAPAGWSARVDELPDPIAATGTAAATLVVEAPAQADPGTRSLTLRLTREDPVTPPERTAVEVDARVPEGPSWGTEGGPRRLELPPGALARERVFVVNEGNAEGAPAVGATAEGAVQARVQAAAAGALAPGASAPATLEVEAPPAPGFGNATARIQVDGEPRGEVRVVERTLDVAVTDARLDEAPAGPVLDLEVANRGQVRPSALEVTVETGDRRAEHEVPAPDPDRRAEHRLPLPDGASAAATVEIAAAGGGVDATPADNRVEATGGADEAPGPAPGLVVAVAAVLALAVGRQSP